MLHKLSLRLSLSKLIRSQLPSTNTTPSASLQKQSQSASKHHCLPSPAQTPILPSKNSNPNLNPKRPHMNTNITIQPQSRHALDKRPPYRERPKHLSDVLLALLPKPLPQLLSQKHISEYQE